MTATAELHTKGAAQVPAIAEDDIQTPAEPGYRVIRRNGAVTPFDATKITVALTKAFLAVEGSTAAGSRRVHDVVEDLTAQVFSALTRRADAGRTFHIEEIQDQVELALMRGEHHKIARAYVLYRDERARERAAARTTPEELKAAPGLQVKAEDGSLAPLDDARFSRIIEEACAGLDAVSPQPILAESRRNLYDGITLDELSLAPILAARTLVEQEPNYALVSARLLLDRLRREALSFVSGGPEQATQAEMTNQSGKSSRAYPTGIVLPFSGTSTLRIDILISDFEIARLQGEIEIRP